MTDRYEYERMTREEVIQLALDIGLRAARTYKYRGSLEAMTEPERKELEQLLDFANQIIQRDEALLRRALNSLAYWLECGETPGSHDIIQRTHDVLRERLK